MVGAWATGFPRQPFGPRAAPMPNPELDGGILTVRPDGPITIEGMTALTRTVDEYLSTHPRIDGVMIKSETFPGFASMRAFADYTRFIADHHTKVQRIALVSDFALAPV